MACLALLMGSQAYAFDLNSILGNAGSAMSGLVDGLLTKEDITVDDMVGTWTATGSAVSFQSENYLKKAGGAAMAGTIESKLNPYYNQYGLTGSTITIKEDGTFELKVKNMPIKGTIVKNNDGSFDFSFTPFGSVKLGTIKTYVEKPINGLNIMFDAKKLKNILSAVAGFTGNSLAKTASGLLDSYEGLCVGFAYSGTGSSKSATSIFTNKTNTNTNNQTTTNSGEDTKTKATNALKSILGL